MFSDARFFFLGLPDVVGSRWRIPPLNKAITMVAETFQYPHHALFVGDGAGPLLFTALARFHRAK